MEIKQAIINFFSENFMVDFKEDFEDDKSFLENGIIDSTGVLELVLFLEQNYGIKVADDEIIPENLDSFKNIEIYLNKKLNGK
jgi:acyl carrier protein